MAHHGDVARSPPAAAARAAAAPAPGLLAGLASTAQTRLPRLVTGAPAGDVSLDSPRPDGERATNEYVETPFRPAAAPTTPAAAAKSSAAHGGPPPPPPAKSKPGGAVRTSASAHPALHLPVVPHRHRDDKGDARTPPPSVRFSTAKRGIVKQPGATATFKKDAGVATASTGASTSGASTSTADCYRDSIICPECGRCRCESCRKPRALPKKWLCNDSCLCSAESMVDYASCLCCVKGLFYHCSVDYEGDASCTDDPCSCGPPRLVARWGCMGLLSLVLPCLWCYWPLRGCVGLGEKCYARYTNQGCRCEPRQPKLSDVTPEKRLLDASPDY